MPALAAQPGPATPRPPYRLAEVLGWARRWGQTQVVPHPTRPKPAGRVATAADLADLASA